MTNSKSVPFLMLCFCWSIFTFATIIPNQFLYTKEWVSIIVISAILNIVFATLLFNDKIPSVLTANIIIIYLVFNVSKSIFNLSNYVQFFHSKNNTIAIFVISIIIVMYLANFYDSHFIQSALPLFICIVIMLLMTFALNADKIAPSNIYSHNSSYNFTFRNIIVFDWLIPLSVIFKNSKKEKNKIILFIAGVCITLLTLALMQGLTIKGDSLFMLSPIQALFQISTSNLVKRYTYIYTLLLYAGYFSILIITICAFNHLKNFQKRGNISIFIFSIPLFYVISNYNNTLNIFVTIIIVLFVALGSKKEALLAKN